MGKEKATPDSLYYIASLTKSQTATTLLSVLEALDSETLQKASPLLPDNITLKTKIQSIVAEFALADEHAGAHATIEDALGHRLGVAAMEDVYGGEGYTVRDAVRALKHMPMVAELREKQEYLNMGYMLIQHVIETLTGKPVEESHREYLWGPLGMDATYPSLKEARGSGKQLCSGYAYNPLRKRVAETAHVDDYPLIGGGGIISSIRDMTAYLSAVVHGKLPLGKTYQEQLLTPLSLNDSGTPKEHWSHGLYCLGWTQSTYRGRRVVSHTGGINGFNSELFYLPDQKWGLAVLSNSSSSIYAWQPLKMRLLDDLLRVPDADRLPSAEEEWSRKLEHSCDHLATAREKLYPGISYPPPLPLPLPLSSYTGTYASPLRTLVVAVAAPRKTTPVREGVDEVLRTEFVSLGDKVLEMEHISGEYFLGWEDLQVPSASGLTPRRVRFVMGPGGEVVKMGIDFASRVKVDDDSMMIWFKRV